MLIGAKNKWFVSLKGCIENKMTMGAKNYPKIKDTMVQILNIYHTRKKADKTLKKMQTLNSYKPWK